MFPQKAASDPKVPGRDRTDARCNPKCQMAYTILPMGSVRLVCYHGVGANRGNKQNRKLLACRTFLSR
jgi:hypothetical protein